MTVSRRLRRRRNGVDELGTIIRSLTREAGGGSIDHRLCSAMQVPNGEHSG